MRNRSTVGIALVAALLVGLAAHADDTSPSPFRMVRSAGCITCHDVESESRGPNDMLPKAPPFEDVACRYRADSDAANRLASIIRDGSGPLRRDRHWAGRATFETMYPNDLMVTDAEARRIVDWILTLCSKPSSADVGHGKRL